MSPVCSDKKSFYKVMISLIPCVIHIALKRPVGMVFKPLESSGKRTKKDSLNLELINLA